MIVDLPDSTISKVSKKLVSIREEGGAVALGRVLTLVISTTLGHEEEAIEAANDASREHPMRVIVISTADEAPAGEAARLDAQIRVGGDAGASEVILLRAYGETASDEESLVTGLLLPDAPVVAWWPGTAPAVPAESPLGRIAQRRITDAAAQQNPAAALRERASSYAPGDSDFAWTRLTLWRAQLAAVLDQPPYEPITGVRVSGASDSPSTELLAAWLRLQLQVPVDLTITTRATGSSGIHGVVLERASGEIDLEALAAQRGDARAARPADARHRAPRRSLRDCLAEDLRRIAPDELYGEVLQNGLALLDEQESVGGSAA